MKKPNAPCKDCKERKFKCHTYCKAYAEYRAEHEEYAQFIRDRRNADKNILHPKMPDRFIVNRGV